MAQTKVKLISDGVIVQGNLHASHGITTAHIGEGSNLYYTDARVGSYLSTNSFATESYVGTQIANLVDSSPSALNTLNELAAALGDDANFSTTVTNSIALKAPIASPTFTGFITTPYIKSTASGNIALGGVSGISRIQGDSNNDIRFLNSSNQDLLTLVASSRAATFAGNVRISKTDATLEINNSTGSLTNADLYISVEDTGQADVRQYGAYPLAFWTNNTERMRITSGGDVFIGNSSVTTANTAIFLNKSGIITNVLANSGGTTDLMQFYQQNGGGIGTLSRNASGICLNGNGQTNQLVAADSGNVGIGETSPDSLLTVGGDFTATTAKPTVSVSDMTNGGSLGIRGLSPILAFDKTSSGVPKILMDGGGLEFKSGTLDAQGDVHLKIDSFGNVLIGSTSFNTGAFSGTAKGLNVSGITPIVLLHESDTDKDGFIGIAGSTMFVHTADAIPMRFGTSDVERMRITSAGNVGIGTNSPTHKLHVYSAAPTGGIGLKVESGNASNWIQNKSTGSSWQIGSTGSGFQLYNDNTSSYRFIVENGGNVGIGTTSPSANLQVNRNTSTANLINLLDVCASIGNTNSNPGNHYPSGIRVYQGSGTMGSGLAVLNIAVDTNSAIAVNRNTATLETPAGMTQGLRFSAVDSNAMIRFNTANSEKMRITSGGNVGIGTDSPASKLVVRTSTDHNFEVEETGGELRLSALNNARSANIGLQFAASEFNFLTGNVGIGTTSPTSPTSVTTFLAIEGTTAGIVLSDNGNAAYKWDIWNSGGGLFMKYNDTTFGVCQLSNGNVGIGTTSPVAQLDVKLHSGTGAYNKSCGARIGRIQYAWYTGRSYANNSYSYTHIKTNLWMGGSSQGNTQYIMGGFNIESFAYGPGYVGRGEIKFHNWSGSFHSLVVRNTGTWSTFVQNPYTSSDGYCVIVIRHNYYSTPNIDFHQSYTDYPWRDVQVTAQAQSNNTTGVY